MLTSFQFSCLNLVLSVCLLVVALSLHGGKGEINGFRAKGETPITSTPDLRFQRTLRSDGSLYTDVPKPDGEWSEEDSWWLTLKLLTGICLQGLNLYLDIMLLNRMRWQEGH